MEGATHCLRFCFCFFIVSFDSIGGVEISGGYALALAGHSIVVFVEFYMILSLS